jgi:hypothetical protein
MTCCIIQPFYGLPGYCLRCAYKRVSLAIRSKEKANLAMDVNLKAVSPSIDNHVKRSCARFVTPKPTDIVLR